MSGPLIQELVGGAAIAIACHSRGWKLWQIYVLVFGICILIKSGMR